MGASCVFKYYMRATNKRLGKAGDVVGCGVDYVTDRVFFTKNGAFLGEYGIFISLSLSHEKPEA